MAAVVSLLFSLLRSQTSG